MKKVILSLLIATLLSSSLMVSAEKVNSFKDVSQSDWYYNSVSAMTEMGYFAGKGPIINGVGVFAPNDTMTKAEFLTVVARIVIGEDNIYKNEGSEWWQDYYTALVDHRVIGSSDFEENALNEPMTREEMAYVSVKAMAYLKEDFSTLNTDIIIKAIPDINTATAKYKSYIAKAYGKGILCGVDSIGTYNPKGSLQRAAATTVLYRIIEKGQRAKVSFEQTTIAAPNSTISDTRTDTPETNYIVNLSQNKDNQPALLTPRERSGIPKINPNNGETVPDELRDSKDTEPITIYEDRIRHNRPAKEGDTFVKADGTRIIVKKDSNGLVGGGQGLELDFGLQYNGAVVRHAMYGASFNYDRLQGTYMWTDSYGNDINNQRYGFCYTTGEYHWELEWQYLIKKYPMPTHKGTADEVSKEGYELYYWDDTFNRWEVNVIFM